MRNFGIDFLRVFACLFVIIQHAGEFYYIGEGGISLTGHNAQAAGIFCSFARMAVPLFVMISGFFLLPIKEDTTTFIRKRLSKIVLPFLFWCAIYAFYQVFQGVSTIREAFVNILNIPLNYGVTIGHLWYIYMLIGLYLFIPILSPWLQKATKKELHIYLGLWGVALCLPYIHLIFPSVLGECFWNGTPLLYYFSGTLGYMILAFYFRKYYKLKGPKNIFLGILLLMGGYSISAFGFFKLLGTVEYVQQVELTWGFETINVAMMALGIFLLFKDLTIKNKYIVQVITSLSMASFGIYLAHIIFLNLTHDFIDPLIDSAFIKIPLISVLTIIMSYICVRLFTILPFAEKTVGYSEKVMFKQFRLE